MLGNRLAAPVVVLVGRVRDWPVTAQQRARRNAMVAATACAQRRVEREDVADFLARRYRPAADEPTTPTATAVRG